MSPLQRLLAIIDALSAWSGKAVGFLLLPAIAVIAFEVVSRYVFNAPTLWATEAVTFLIGSIYILGGAYTLYVRGHINVETLYNQLRPRGRAALRVFVHFPLFAIYIGVLFWMGAEFALDSVLEGERSGSAWNPPIYPVKLVIPLGVLLMLLQGLAQLVHDVLFLLGREDARRPWQEEGGGEL